MPSDMTSRYSDVRPLQVRIVDDVRTKIEAGHYAPGEQLPTLQVLADQYRCSLAVVRKALDLLRQQGLVITRHGKGSYVREPVSVVRYGMERYARSRWSGSNIVAAESSAQNVQSRRIIRDLAEVSPPESVASRLGAGAGEPVWVRRRTVFLDERPSQLADSYYPLGVAGGTALQSEETGPGGDFARLSDAGHSPTRVREEWFARMPTGPESSDLQIPDGTPVIDFIRTIYDQADRPIEVMLSVIAADTVSFLYDFPVPD